MRPIILAIGGHDPTGGAGIQADIETIGQLGGQAVTIPTAITLQNSHQVVGFEPVAAHLLSQQGRMLLEEFPIAAIKIGMVA
ncbi:MAG: hydroxymethylpyrimidine/phosphomethylpyrimidine kinase, partial [Gammaproteobacteria bacterium]|nr:hydroxymethylpyrimidine/phosphomethylpyrimidine kinase [Gammaproteobacteria bacterium]